MNELHSLLVFLCFVFQSCLGDNSSSIPWPPKVKYFTQPTDHFSFHAGNLTFAQRYLYEDKWYKSDGPILFYCGNEGEIEGFWNNSGYIFELAVSTQALVVFAEHRYYGESLPFPNCFTQPYIQYLSVEQALADFAYLIEDLKHERGFERSPVIAFGGSYGGMLAAYMRAKYPHLVAGAIASSAPVYWIAGMGRFHEFFERVTKDYTSVAETCSSRIKDAYLMAEKLASTDLKKLSEVLRLCVPLKSRFDFEWMLKWSRNAFVMMAMLDYPVKTSFMGNLPAFPVNVSCARALAAPNALAGLREAVGVMYNSSEDLACYDYKNEFIECADITGCGLGNSSLAWDFQCCTEMNLFDESTATSEDMFPSLTFTRAQLIDYCQSRWGVMPAFRQMSAFYGPNIWKSASNILFTNGDLDPWMGGGVHDDQSPTVKSMVIHGGAHHLDLRSPDVNDPPSARVVRQAELNMILGIVNKRL